MREASTGNHKRPTAGFSTIEILIAFAILVVGLSGILLVVFGNDSWALDSQLNSEALNLAGRELARAEGEAKSDFTHFFGLATTTDDTRYETTVLVTDLTPCKKLLESTTT